MPRLSLYRTNKSADYKFFDRRISEMFTVGATDINLHKYLGPIDQGPTGDATQPTYANQSELNIQDLLFLENRDRKYAPDIYTLRGSYQLSDLDFDLSQFGLFLTGDTIFVSFHLNDMVETVGRKIMSGDVLEFPHRKDLYALNEDLPTALKRYYVVQDASFSAEGYSPTWYPHIWRIKCIPLVDSQEYADLLKQIKVSEGIGTGVGATTGDTTLGDLLSTYNQSIAINDAIVTQAEAEVLECGYDTTKMFIMPTNPDGTPADPMSITADGVNDASDINVQSDAARNSPRHELRGGYITEDGIPPNGLPVAAGIAFPANPVVGDYALRLDFKPNRLFRFDGKRWVKQEDDLRNPMNWADSTETLKGGFINNTDTVRGPDGTMVPSRQSLSDALKPKADN